MAQRAAVKTSFEPRRIIEPIYTGGTVALSNDGRVLATALGEDTLITDLATGDRLARIEGDGEAVTTYTLTPSASHLAICSRSLSMRIYALDRTANTPEGSRPVISSSLTRTLKPHTAPVVTCATDSTGTLLATGASDGVVKVWDIRGGYTTHTLHGHGSIVSALHFFGLPTVPQSTSGRKSSKKNTGGYCLASGTEDGKIRIWNLETRKTLATLDSHVSVVKALEYDEHANHLLSASRDKTAMIWNCADWTVHRTIPVLEAVEAAGLLEAGTLAYTGGENGRLRLWTTKTGQEVPLAGVQDAAGIVQTIHFPELPFILSIHADQVLRLHSTVELSSRTKPDSSSTMTLPVVRQVSGTHDEIIDFGYVGRDKEVLAVVTNVEDIRLLSLTTSQPSRLESVDFPAESNYFGADVGVLKGHEDIVICLDIDWSGCWLVSGAKDNTAKLWRIDVAKGSFNCHATLTGHAESIGAITLPHSPPAAGSDAFENPLAHPPSFVVTGSQDKTIKRWEIRSVKGDETKGARASYTRKAHDKDINALDTNHNSTLLASASQDRTVKIWSLEDGETIGVLRGHRRGVWTVKFAPADTPAISVENGGQKSAAKGLVLTGSGDKTVKIWSLADYSCLRTFEGHTNSVLKVVWMNLPQKFNEKPADDPNEDEEMDLDEEVPRAPVKRTLQAASAGGDGLVKIWDVPSGELATTLDNHTDRVWALTCHPDTNNLISGGGDSVITFWTDTTSSSVAAAAAESTARIEQDQALQNYIRTGSYREAITLSLQLNHPGRLLRLFKEVTGTYPPEQDSLCGVKAVDEVLATLGDEQLMSLLARIRDWNTNAKTAPTAQRILWVLLQSYSPARLLNLRAISKGSNMREMLDAIRVYTERHYGRMEEMIDESFLLEYTLQQMDGTAIDTLHTNGIISSGS